MQSHSGFLGLVFQLKILCHDKKAGSKRKQGQTLTKHFCRGKDHENSLLVAFVVLKIWIF